MNFGDRCPWIDIIYEAQHVYINWANGEYMNRKPRTKIQSPECVSFTGAKTSCQEYYWEMQCML